MKRFLFLIIIALAAMLPAVAIRSIGLQLHPVIAMMVFGVAVLAAGFMLSWSAEAAETRVPQGLILAVVALITVLPEYAVDMYYAFQAGRNPQSNYVHYATANMTGANRLLVGMAWPLMAALHWWRNRERHIQLANVNVVEIGFLLLASLYAFGILLKDRIDLVDSVALAVIFAGYLWQVGKMPEADSDADEDDETGPAAVLKQLEIGAQWVWMGGLAAVAGVVILISAEPFAESIVASGKILGIDEFLLIQWLAPLASEAPAIVIAILFVLSGRAAGGLTAMISDKINQWTLLVGMLPLAMSVGASGVMALPLDARQHEEFFLTAAQSLFGIALLLRLRFSIWSALSLGVLFILQLVLAFVYRNDAIRAIASLTTLGWIYLGLAAALFIAGLPAFLRTVRIVASLSRKKALSITEPKR